MELGGVAGERRCIAVDERRLRERWRLREHQPLGEVVELEHPLLADDDELSPLVRREPVDVEHAPRTRREAEQAEQEILVCRVDALSRLGMHADRSLAGDPAEDVDVVGRQVDRHPDVADPRRERACPAADDRVDRGEPAVGEQAAELQDRRVESLHVADLHGNAARLARLDDPERLIDGGCDRLLDEDSDVTLDRRPGEGLVGGRRSRDDDRVEVGLRDHRERLRESLGASRAGGRFDGGRQRVGNGGNVSVRVCLEHTQVVAAHRSESGEADAHRAIPCGPPSTGAAGHLAMAPAPGLLGTPGSTALAGSESARSAPTGASSPAWASTAARTASTTIACSSSVRPG